MVLGPKSYPRARRGRAVNRWQRSDGPVTEANRSKKPERKQKASKAEQSLVAPSGDRDEGVLAQRLKTHYGLIVDEPLPEEILALLRKH